MSGVQLGNIGEWIAAIGTVGALAFALWQNNKRQSEKVVDEEKKQAENVSVYGVYSVDEGRYAGKIVVSNASSLPIYNLVIKFLDYNAKQPVNISPGADSIFYFNVNTVPPGKWSIEASPPRHYKIERSYRIEIAFTDTGGRTWTRNSDGILEKHTQDDFMGGTFLKGIDWESQANPGIVEED